MADTVKHTPGPWHVGYRGLDIGCTNAKIGGHAKLFDVRGWGYLTGNGHGALGLTEDEAIAVQKANALLVATAPDLLTEAKRAAEIMERHIYPKPDVGPDHPYSVLQALQAVIAKAEGRS